MTAAGHVANWPDKILSSALLVMVAGALAILHGALELGGASFADDTAFFLYDIPAWWLLALGGVTTVLGFLAFRHQAWLLTVAGIVTGVWSFGLLGASSLLCLVAVWPLIQSFREGEETHLDRHRMHGHQWPDKAIMAAVLIAAGGAVSLIQGALLFADRLSPPFFAASPGTWAVASIVAGLFAFYAGREVFHLRHPWTGWLASGLLVAAAGFYVVGPVLGVAALIYLGLAEKEAEFLLHAEQKTGAGKRAG